MSGEQLFVTSLIKAEQVVGEPSVHLGEGHGPQSAQCGSIICNFHQKTNLKPLDLTLFIG